MYSWSTRGHKKLCVLLEHTRAMDTVEDWAERKEQGKNDRCGPLIGFINHLSHRGKSGWKASQTNFTTGVRGSLHQPVPYETRVARGKEFKHAGSHTKQNGSKNPLYVGYDSQVFLYRTKLQDRLDTPKPTHRNRQQEHGKI